MNYIAHLIGAVTLLLTTVPLLGVDSRPSSTILPEGAIPDGPWGEIEYFPFYLEPPNHYLTTRLKIIKGDVETIWKFSTSTREDVASILRQAQLDPSMISDLVSSDRMITNEVSGFYEIRPSDSDIIRLNSEQRGLLYPNLYPREPGNPFNQPLSLPAEGPEYLTAFPSGLSSDQIDLIHRLTYRRGQLFLFSDFRFILKNAGAEPDQIKLLKTLHRQRTSSVRLVLSAESDLSQLAQFWGSNGRNRDVFPILESVVRTSGIDSLDVTHLLPPTPRKLLNTFPDASHEAIGNDYADCFWTSFSFFEEEPSSRHLDLVTHVFRERYEEAKRPLQLGDIVLLKEAETNAPVHACNYIAGDLVFTKNGKSLGRPWVIEPIETLLQSYLQGEPLRISFLRLKPEFQR